MNELLYMCQQQLLAPYLCNSDGMAYCMMRGLPSDCCMGCRPRVQSCSLMASRFMTQPQIITHSLQLPAQPSAWMTCCSLHQPLPLMHHMAQIHS